MLIICEDCAKRYNIDISRIKSNRARFTCKKCGHIIIIDKEDLSRRLIAESVTPEDKISANGTEDLLKEMIDGDIDASSTTDNPSPKRKKKSFFEKVQNPSFTLFFLLVFVFSILIIAGVVVYLLATNISKDIQPGEKILWSLILISAAWLLSLGACLLKAHSLSRSLIGLKDELIALVKGEQREVTVKKGPREFVELTQTISKIIRLRDYF